MIDLTENEIMDICFLVDQFRRGSGEDYHSRNYRELTRKFATQMDHILTKSKSRSLQSATEVATITSQSQQS